MSAAIRIGSCAALLASLALASRLEAQVNPEGNDVPEGVEVLMQGPLHEAFATSYSPNPAAGSIVAAEPPQPIEEVPPVSQPAGSVWIPGYWYWSDDDQTYLWISGVWRVPPPDRVWITGYWTANNGGYQWVSGFWSPEETESVLYLPPPPDSLEAGPSSPRPGNNYFWIVGRWAWNDGRYLWQPGYWAQTQPGYVWYPDSYYWTPSGTVYLQGYWDYPFAQRGIPFAPVRFTNAVYTRPNYFYRPAVALNVGLLAVHLFVRPTGYNYYFGDYYGNDFVNRGYYPWYQRDGFRNGFRRGYDPFFAYYSNTDPAYLNVLDNRYQYFVRNERARPPRQFRNLLADGRDRSNTPMLAATLTQLSSNPDLFTRNAVVANNESRLLSNLTRLRQMSDQENVAMRQRANRLQEFQQRRGQIESAARERPEQGGRGARRLDLANLIDRGRSGAEIDGNRIDRDRNRDGRPDRNRRDGRSLEDRQEIEASQPNGRPPVTESNQPGPAGTQPPAPTDREANETPVTPRVPETDRDRPAAQPGDTEPGRDNERLRPDRRRQPPGQRNPRENEGVRPETQEPVPPDQRRPNAASPPTDREPANRPNRLQRNQAENEVREPGQPSDRDPRNVPPETQPVSPEQRRPNVVQPPTGRDPATRPNPLPRNRAENPTRPPESDVLPGRRNNIPDATPAPREPNRSIPGPDNRVIPAPNVPDTRVRPPVRQPGTERTPRQEQPGVPDARRQRPATPSLPTRPDGITPNVDSNQRGGPVLGPQQSPLQPRTRPTPPTGDFDLNFRLRPESRRPGIDQGQQRPPGVNPQTQPGVPQQNRQIPGLEGRGRQRLESNRPEVRGNRPQRNGDRPPAEKPQPEPPKKDG